MNVNRRNDVSVYCLSSGPTLPEWLGDRAKRNLAKKDENIRRRIELIQEFQMPASSSRLIQSPDGRYIFASGTYPPRIRCYDVHELSMKFERYTNSEVLDMVMLGEDYGKIAMLLDDRTVAFHAPYGAHESIRVPTFGRAMAYDPTTCEVLVAAKGSNVYRINLEEGRFSEPWDVDCPGVSANCITVSRTHPLAALGCEDGLVRFWDNRSPDSMLKPFLKLDVQSAAKGYGYAEGSHSYQNPGEITAIATDPSGLYMAAGTAGGCVALYDVRSSRPLHIQEHKHGVKINTIKFHSGSGTILSSDEHLIKCWRYKSDDTLDGGVRRDETSTGKSDSLGSVKVNIEGSGKFQHFIMAGDERDPFGDNSGVILCATDQPKMDSYFVPAIGVAPKWCSFLENITEELEERDLTRDGAGGDLVRDGQETIYENYKFVSRDDLETLGISNLVGTPLLRGYMHGFFMDVNLYNRVKAVANPFEYAEYQKKKLKERLEAKRASRISAKSSIKKKAAVNAELAERLEQKATSSTKAGKNAKSVLSDDRFGGLFDNPDFDIDEDDFHFKMRNPSGVAATNLKKDNLDSDSDSHSEVENHQSELDDPQSSGEDSYSSAESDEDGFAGGKIRGEEYDNMKSLGKKRSKQTSFKSKKSAKSIVMESDAIDAKEIVDMGLGKASADDRAQRRIEEMKMPLAKRAALLRKEEAEKPQMRVKGGNKEMSFVPRDNRKAAEADTGRPRGNKRDRRGIKDLRLKTPFKNKR